ncbi:MAG: hypothetical protein FJ387_07450 [Verrucomicrobia bacterium]|nr:hypothetical protein [Verrucomicrobiota bacterium]
MRLDARRPSDLAAANERQFSSVRRSPLSAAVVLGLDDNDQASGTWKCFVPGLKSLTRFGDPEPRSELGLRTKNLNRNYSVPFFCFPASSWHLTESTGFGDSTK